MEKVMNFWLVPVLILALVGTVRWAVCEEPGDLQEIEEIDNKKPAENEDVTPADDESPAADTKSIKAEIEVDKNLLILVKRLQDKELELAKAKREIIRLKKIIIKIQEASKRERIILKATLHYNKACLYRANRMYKEAEAEYLKALEINPPDAAVHYNLGLLYDDDLKNAKKARKHYKQFLALAPDDKDAPRVREWLISLQ